MEIVSQPETGRILVVDDEATMRRLLEKLLRMEGYDVLLAASGEQALAELLKHGADTVLLDMRMPGMTGLDVCRQIRHHPRSLHTPVVFITAVNDRELRRKGMEAGADDFLSKPFDEVELLATGWLGGAPLSIRLNRTVIALRKGEAALVQVELAE